MANTPNPLKSYFRTIKAYAQLPSADFDFYPKTVLDYTDLHKKEIGVQPMTAVDELALKDPDALLNGEAIKSVIKSVAPQIKDPGKMFINDINALLAVSRAVSLGNEMPINVTCPECKVSDTYALNLEGITENIQRLASEYIIPHDDLQVYVKPRTFDAHLAGMSISFEESKLVKVFQDVENYTDIDRVRAMSRAVKKISKLNFDQISECIVKIVLSNGTVVTNQEHIAEFIKNVDNRFSKAVDTKVNEISKIGISPTTIVSCRSCKHEWEEPIGFNPMDFFTQS